MNELKIVCNLEKFLNEAGVPIVYFCDMMGISRTCYYQWIKGEKLPTIEKCYHAKDILEFELERKISVEELWTLCEV